MTMESWTKEHNLAAVRQGWCISEVLCGDDHAPWEIQRLDDAHSATADYGVPVPQLDDDDAAVAAMRLAYERNEPHAVLAYQLIHDHSRQEFDLWDMGSWQKTG